MSKKSFSIHQYRQLGSTLRDLVSQAPLTIGHFRALYLIGFGIGPLFAGPLSEAFGRNPVYAFTFLGFIIFQLGPALGENAQTVFICRFFAGFFGSTPLSNAGGSVNDMFNPLDRTVAFPIFATMPFVGPAVCISLLFSNWKYTDDSIAWASHSWCLHSIRNFNVEQHCRLAMDILDHHDMGRRCMEYVIQMIWPPPL